MGDRYNLYESLGLDSAAGTEELHAKLSGQLSELRDAGVSEYSGEFQEKFTALQVLGDEGRRREYDALLADENATVTIATLRELASRPDSAAPSHAISLTPELTPNQNSDQNPNQASYPTPDQTAQQQNAQSETSSDSRGSKLHRNSHLRNSRSSFRHPNLRHHSGRTPIRPG